MTSSRKTMNIYYSEVTVLLESFIFLFEPIYKKTFTSQSLNLTYSKIEKFFSKRSSSALSFIGHYFLISSLRFPLPLWSALKMLETCLAWSSLAFSYLNSALDTWPVRSLMSFSSTPLWNNREAHVIRRQWAVFFFILTARHKSHYKCKLDWTGEKHLWYWNYPGRNVR